MKNEAVAIFDNLLSILLSDIKTINLYTIIKWTILDSIIISS